MHLQLEMFKIMREFTKTEDGLILFILGLIAIAEIFDFATGSFAAIINPEIEWKSKIGINGLIRKIIGLALLLLLLPMSVLLPEQTGGAFLYTIYIGYLLLTFKSLVENYGKAKGNTSIFENVVATFSKLTNKKEE